MPTDSIERLRPLRRSLVEAAEANFQHHGVLPEKAQFSRLINVCSEASCAEEIVNYLRYQASRDRPLWDRAFADQVIQKVGDILTREKLDNDEMRVEAWRLYATYLSRAFTYAKAASRGGPQGPAQGRTPPAQGHGAQGQSRPQGGGRRG